MLLHLARYNFSEYLKIQPVELLMKKESEHAPETLLPNEDTKEVKKEVLLWNQLYNAAMESKSYSVVFVKFSKTPRISSTLPVQLAIASLLWLL